MNGFPPPSYEGTANALIVAIVVGTLAVITVAVALAVWEARRGHREARYRAVSTFLEKSQQILAAKNGKRAADRLRDVLELESQLRSDLSRPTDSDRVGERTKSRVIKIGVGVALSIVSASGIGLWVQANAKDAVEAKRTAWAEEINAWAIETYDLDETTRVSDFDEVSASGDLDWLGLTPTEPGPSPDWTGTTRGIVIQDGNLVDVRLAYIDGEPVLIYVGTHEELSRHPSTE